MGARWNTKLGQRRGGWREIRSPDKIGSSRTYGGQLGIVGSVPRASEILSAVSGPPGLSEADLRTECPVCGHMQRLDEALFLDGDPFEVVYRCSACIEPILVVSTPGVVPWEGRGTSVLGWMIRNPSDVWIRAFPGAQESCIPAACHALD